MGACMAGSEGVGVRGDSLLHWLVDRVGMHETQQIIFIDPIYHLYRLNYFNSYGVDKDYLLRLLHAYLAHQLVDKQVPPCPHPLCPGCNEWMHR